MEIGSYKIEENHYANIVAVASRLESVVQCKYYCLKFDGVYGNRPKCYFWMYDYQTACYLFDSGATIAEGEDICLGCLRGPRVCPGKQKIGMISYNSHTHSHDLMRNFFGCPGYCASIRCNF